MAFEEDELVEIGARHHDEAVYGFSGLELGCKLEAPASSELAQPPRQPPPLQRRKDIAGPACPSRELVPIGLLSEPDPLELVGLQRAVAPVDGRRKTLEDLLVAPSPHRRQCALSRRILFVAFQVGTLNELDAAGAMRARLTPLPNRSDSSSPRKKASTASDSATGREPCTRHILPRELSAYTIQHLRRAWRTSDVIAAWATRRGALFHHGR